ncbi:hypothetical protein [Endozoicomonas lisbonensis]|uniref:Metallo-beta-lactamase domain-containing protein n=1 Tax=Endozoicomonas lisbonensis TaxID=3120522 RepID=A0ABV2SGW8_9GAMM
MKVIKQLEVDGKPYPLIKDDVRLSLKRPGRAILNVTSTQPLSGLVILDIGWSHARPKRFFMGYVVESLTVSTNEQQLLCNEVAAALDSDHFMGLRHTTVNDVLAKMAKGTPLTFVTPESGYCKKQSPYFFHLGGGYQAMDAIGPVFQIPNYIWQQQGDGTIFVGSWDDSRWPSRSIPIPDKVFKRHIAQGTAELAMVPGLRPGVLFNRGIVTAVQLKKERMVISWKKKSAAFT